MHTINEIPANFDGEQIVRAKPGGAVRLVESLAQIRREQHAARQYRLRMGYASFDARHPKQLGYVRVVG